MTSWHGYPKIYNLGHAELKELFSDDVIIEEKIDGSQFSFGKFDGKLKVRSKGREMHLPLQEKDMFSRAITTVQELLPNLIEGYTYRGEYLAKPHHNALTYDRTPEKHIIIFDINIGEEQYLSYEGKVAAAISLGLEVVPILHRGKVANAEELFKLLETTSVLGGQKIEGFVIKNYSRFGRDKKALMGKHVNEAYKEVHKKTWGESNPGSKDILTLIGSAYKSEARWNKAIQHLAEAGHLTNTPKDIGFLMKEVPLDIKEECTEEIKDALFKWAWPHIQRQVARGLPEWYKNKLLESQFLKTGEE